MSVPLAQMAARVPRRGFTMVELLIVVAIISILASLVLFAMAASQEAAREARTKALIATLHSVVMEQYDSYRTRRVPVNTSGMSPSAAAKERLHAIRSIMQREMPDRWSDVTTAPSNASFNTALSQAYASYVSGKTSHANFLVHQGAECLFAMVTLGNPDAAAMIPAANIADSDGDGLQEFIDGWGKPISFIRWPAGFASELQSLNGLIDPDPFDPLRVDPNWPNPPANVGDFVACRLVPLVYSGGPDQSLNFLTNPPSPDPSFVYPVTNGVLDPYAIVGSTGRRMAAPAVAASPDHIDNIHNHLIGLK